MQAKRKSVVCVLLQYVNLVRVVDAPPGAHHLSDTIHAANERVSHSQSAVGWGVSV